MKSIILGVGIALVLSSCGSKSESGDAGSSEGIKFGYFVKDSLLTGFDYYRINQESFQKDELALRNEMGRFQEEGQKMMAQMNSKMSQGLLSENGRKYYENELQRIQLELTSLEQTKGAALQERAIKFNEEIVELLDELCAEFSSENGLNALFGKEVGGQIYYMDSSMNYTSEFLEFLNKNKEVDSSSDEDQKEEE
ncbi:MAG: OmpH family outer membrane protein [Crocinitomicaceae bacterium]|nr:OmpH family outer membrane protein [Crocinitomicaceae bacterium]